jgi:hypothetical protein
MAANISVDGISPASEAFDALTITMTITTELLNWVDGNAIEVGHFPTLTTSQTRNSPIDNNRKKKARQLLWISCMAYATLRVRPEEQH